MKKVNIVILVTLMSVFSCVNKASKNDKSPLLQPKEPTILDKKLSGNYLFVNDEERGPAAVLQMDSEIYGVIIDSMVYALNALVSPIKQKETDMVFVSLIGEVKSKTVNEEGWPLQFKIKEIVEVSEEFNDTNVIKIGK